MDTSNVTLGMAFLAGVASFLSPCVFALVPAYIGYLSGRSVASQAPDDRFHTLFHGLAFVLGFSVVFITLGVATSALGGLIDLKKWMATIGGALIILFGLHMTGIIRVPLLEYDLRPQATPDNKRGFWASFQMGIFFSAGWSPCVGPILGSIIMLSAYGGSVYQGAIMLAAYSVGLAIPFLIAATQVQWVTNIIRRHGKVMHYAEVVMGVVLVVLGAMLHAGRIQQLSSIAPSFLGSYDVESELIVGRNILLVLAGLLLLGLIPAFIASRKGRNFYQWWFFGAGLFPIAMPMSWFIKPREPKEREEQPRIVDSAEARHVDGSHA